MDNFESEFNRFTSSVGQKMDMFNEKVVQVKVPEDPSFVNHQEYRK